MRIHTHTHICVCVKSFLFKNKVVFLTYNESIRLPLAVDSCSCAKPRHRPTNKGHMLLCAIAVNVKL